MTNDELILNLLDGKKIRMKHWGNNKFIFMKNYFLFNRCYHVDNNGNDIDDIDCLLPAINWVLYD